VEIGTQRPPRTIGPETANTVTFEDFVEAGFKDRLALKEQLNGAGWSLERLFSAWQRNRRIANEQRELMTSDVDVESLAIALKNCPNLESIRLTGGVGIGGVEKLSRNGLGETFVFGPIYRADGRQLTALLLAATKISETEKLAPRTKFRSLIMEENYWDELRDRTSYNKTYVDYDQRLQSNFGSISVRTITSAFPFLSSITTLQVSLRPKNGHDDVPSIGRNLTLLLLVGLQHLRSLSLHNSEYYLLSLQRPLQSLSSTSIHTLTLQNCIIHMSTMEIFLCTQASTLAIIHLENIALVGGQYTRLLSVIRDTARVNEFVTKGWLLEFDNETQGYVPEDEYDVEDFEMICERRDQARMEIAAFVQREREDLPVELLYEDSSGRISNALGQTGVIEFIGGTKFLPEEDYEY
jgi:hypothetical protein